MNFNNLIFCVLFLFVAFVCYWMMKDASKNELSDTSTSKSFRSIRRIQFRVYFIGCLLMAIGFFISYIRGLK